MHKLVLALVATVLFALVVGGPSPAVAAASTSAAASADRAADTTAGSRVVTKAEFRRVRKGWSMPRVHGVFDTAGKQTFFDAGCCGGALPASQWRDYRTPSRYGFVSLTFERRNGVWRMTGKSAYWG